MSAPTLCLTLQQITLEGKGCGRVTIRTMYRFILLSLLSLPAWAQTAQLTTQLGRTILYHEVALSPDGKRAAWTQKLASQGSAQTYVAGTLIKLAGAGPRS